MYAETGEVRYRFRNFAFLQDDSVAAAEASYCAADQGQFWSYHDTLYANQGPFSERALKNYAEELGLDTEMFDDCLESGQYSDRVRQELEEGRAKGVGSTPTFFINGNMITGAKPFETFQQAIEDELGRAG